MTSQHWRLTLVILPLSIALASCGSGSDSAHQTADDGEKPAEALDSPGTDNATIPTTAATEQRPPELPTGPDNGMQEQFCSVDWSWNWERSRFAPDIPQWELDLEIQQEGLAELRIGRDTLMSSAPDHLRDLVARQLEHDEDRLQARVALIESAQISSDDERWDNPLGFARETLAEHWIEQATVELASWLYCDAIDEELLDTEWLPPPAIPTIQLEGYDLPADLGDVATAFARDFFRLGPGPALVRHGDAVCQDFASHPTVVTYLNLIWVAERQEAEDQGVEMGLDSVLVAVEMLASADDRATIETVVSWDSPDGFSGTSSSEFTATRTGESWVVACP